MPSSKQSIALHDPAARSRLWGAVVAVVVLWPLFDGAGVSVSALFDADNLRVIGGFLANFLPPDTSAEFAGYLWQATLETLAIATLGLLLAFVLAVPLSYLATSAVRERASQNPVARAVMTVLRGIPELVWALVFVRVFGLGPAAGVLALGLTYGGMLGKVYAEILKAKTAPPPVPCCALAAHARWPCCMACCRWPQGTGVLHGLPLGMCDSRLGGHGLCGGRGAGPAHGSGHEDAQWR